MVEENARVIAIDGDFAWVETRRKAVCEACSVNKGCGTSVLSKVLGNRRIRLRTLNHVNAKVGDEVVIGFEEKMLVRYSFAAYASPILLLLSGAWVGEAISKSIGWSGSEALTILFGIAGMTAGFVLLQIYSNRVSADSRYQPIILRSMAASHEQTNIKTIHWNDEFCT